MPEVGNRLLIEKIVSRIRESDGRAISFRDYMDMCLYDDEYGYYTAKSIKIGKQGDFYTSPSVGGIMGEVLAMDAVRTIPLEQPVRLVEWGAGTGILAKQMMDTLLTRYPDRYKTVLYTIVDISPDHLEQAKAVLADHSSQVQFISPTEWIDGKRPAGFTYMLSNELLDSFPVHRVRMQRGRLRELYVSWDEIDHRFVELARPCTNTNILEYVEDGNIQLLDGQTTEINMMAGRWIADRLSELEEGILLTIDYGDRAEELYGGHRMNGTLVCYKRHAAHDNPYIHAGRQDMTAHVDFSACIRAGERMGAATRLLTQREYLVEAGILTMLQDNRSPDPFSPIAKRNRAIRQLLLSDQMSELFKVLIQIKK